MRVLFLTRYASRGASSRLRFFQLAPGLTAAGIGCHFEPLFDDAYLDRCYRDLSPGRTVYPYRARRRARDIIPITRAYAGRLLASRRLDRFDVVVVEKELLPALPAALELALLRRARRLVTDHDDAIAVQYRGQPLLAGKIGRIMARSDAVVAANQVLAAEARRHCPRVEVVPTVVDLARYPVREHLTAGGRVRIGWIGTPVTAPFLLTALPMLTRLAERVPLELIAIGAGSLPATPGLAARVLPWRLEDEGADLASLDIGIMPLPDDDFCRGKSAYKLIQYMAAGLPTVASPVGANRDVTIAGETGLLASSPAEWEAALGRLSTDASLRAAMGRAGRARVAERYSLPAAVEAYRTLLSALSDGRTAPQPR